MTPNGCPLCGTPNHSCGQPFTGTPIDLPRMEARVMSGGVKRYRVNVNGTDTVLKLSSEDVKRYKDAVPVDTTADAQPDSDAPEITAEADGSAEDDKAADTKAVTAQNKSRTASNKGGRGGGARNN